MDDRRYTEPPRPGDLRGPFRRDRDRVLYSPHFARLAEITQVVSPERGYVFHNRLTHSMKVAQVARTIAEFFQSKHATELSLLGGLDPDAAEAAGLAHDLGHPPFGHIAEVELDRLVQRAGVNDGFEGNAQSFRIVCQLTIGDAWTQIAGEAVPVSGLNLTRATLAGVIKYPWPRGGNPSKPNKWGYYQEESEFFDWARSGLSGSKRTLIAEIMDWADDVTYAIHDLLDFYRAGLIPLEFLRQVDDAPGSAERDRFLTRVFQHRPEWNARREKYEKALESILDRFPYDASHRYSSSERDEQLLYEFATTLISSYVNAIKPVTTGSSVVAINQDSRDQVDVLKELVWQYVILNPEMAQLQTGQRRAIRAVFRESLRAARKREAHFFPGPFRQRLTPSMATHELVRLAADYVAGLTERELMAAYNRFIGLAQA